MEIRVIREHFTPACTIGRMLVDGEFECFTLEDGIRTRKLAAETAIPIGRYPITITHSPAFRRRLPLLGNVPEFSGVRIHPGNTSVDTAGCILVGRGWTPGDDRIAASRLAFEALFAKIETALAAEDAVSITIEQVNAPAELMARALKRRPPPQSTRKKTAAAGKRRGRARKVAPNKTPARHRSRAAGR